MSCLWSENPTPIKGVACASTSNLCQQKLLHLSAGSRLKSLIHTLHITMVGNRHSLSCRWCAFACREQAEGRSRSTCTVHDLSRDWMDWYPHRIDFILTRSCLSSLVASHLCICTHRRHINHGACNLRVRMSRSPGWVLFLHGQTARAASDQSENFMLTIVLFAPLNDSPKQSLEKSLLPLHTHLVARQRPPSRARTHSSSADHVILVSVGDASITNAVGWLWRSGYPAKA